MKTVKKRCDNNFTQRNVASAYPAGKAEPSEERHMLLYDISAPSIGWWQRVPGFWKIPSCGGVPERRGGFFASERWKMSSRERAHRTQSFQPLEKSKGQVFSTESWPTKSFLEGGVPRFGTFHATFSRPWKMHADGSIYHVVIYQQKGRETT